MKNKLRRQRGSAVTLGLSVVAVALSVLLLIPLVRQAVGWYFFTRATEAGLLYAARYDSRNDTYPYLLGRLYLTSIQAPERVGITFEGRVPDARRSGCLTSPGLAAASSHETRATRHELRATSHERQGETRETGNGQTGNVKRLGI